MPVLKSHKLIKMAQNTTYREQTSLGLGPETGCPACGSPAPSFFSYQIEYCNNPGTTAYVAQTQAYFGTSPVINSNLYIVGDVVWVTATATGPRACAEIIDVELDQEPSMYVDIEVGPFDVCSSCIDPNPIP